VSRGLSSVFLILIGSSCEPETNWTPFDVELTFFFIFDVTGRHFHRSYSPNGTTCTTMQTGQNIGGLESMGTGASRRTSMLTNLQPHYLA